MADDKETFDEVPEGITNLTDDFGRTFSRALSTTSIEVLDLVSEGEIEGPIQGIYEYQGTLYNLGYDSVKYEEFPVAPGTNIKWLRSIYWNEVPIVNSENKYNFQNINVSFTPGLPNGAVLNQFQPRITVSRTIGERFRSGEDNAKSYRILNPECRGIYVNIRIQTLQKTVSKEDSDIEDAILEYNVYFKPIYSNPSMSGSLKFALAKRIKVIGKIQYGFIKSDRIDFFSSNQQAYVKDFIGWEIRLVRITGDSLTSMQRNIAYIDSITEIYEEIYNYPNSAIFRSRFSSEYFNQIPNRAFHCRLLKVLIPVNYDPIKKTYDETIPWDGSFKEQKEWTDNPAWCFYDLLTNKNYGLGSYLDANLIDKWTLYEISKYCDVLVPDGYGGLEPRFTCNIILNSRDEAYKVINNMASIFRGLVYFGRGLIYTVQDSPKGHLIKFTNANVKDGDFTYSSSSRRVRHTVAVVRYNDKKNFYKPAIEYVEDVDGIRKYGIREVEIDAIGCTSRGQALRFGRWALLTETLETETVSFVAGVSEAHYLKPGDVFSIVDNNKKLSRYAGRTTKYEYNQDLNKTYVTLDGELNLGLGINYALEVMTPSYNYEPAIVSDLNSSHYNDIRRSFIQTGFFQVDSSNITSNNSQTTITFDGQPFDTNNYKIVDNMIWSLYMNSGLRTYEYLANYPDIYTDYFRVINIAEKDQQEFEIVGLQYNPQKYIEIESGLNFDRYVMQVSNPAPPEYTYSQINNSSVDTQKISINWINQENYINNTHTAIFIDKQSEPTVSNVTVPNKRKLHSLVPTDVTTLDYIPEETGVYNYTIWGYDSRNNTFSSSGISGTFIINNFTPIKDIVVGGLTLTTGTIPLFDNIKGVSRSSKRLYIPSPTFAWQMGTTGESLPEKYGYRVTIRPPSNSNTPHSDIYYEYIADSILSDELTFTFSFEKNLNASGGPFRDYDVVVEAIDTTYKTSAGNIVDPASEGKYTYSETWSNPYGYDILNVSNQRITGLYLSLNPNTISGGYLSRQFIDPSLNINIYYVSGALDEDIAGAYVYYSTGLFSGENITGLNPIISNNNIFTGNAAYDKSVYGFYCPLPHESRWMKQSGYLCLSVYDSFDAELIKYNPMLRTGLPLTNIVNINFSGSTNVLKIGDNINFYNHNDNSNSWNMKTTVIDGRKVIINSYNNNDELIINSQQ